MIHVQHSRPIEEDVEVFQLTCTIHNVYSMCVIPRDHLARLSPEEAEKFVRVEAQFAIKRMAEEGCDCDKDEYVSWNGLIV